MLEILMLAGGQPAIPQLPGDTGIGPSALVAGDNTEGFFGEVPVADFINGTNLATAIGLTSGTVITANINANWLKFAWKNKVVLIPKGGYRSNVSWAQIYACGAVYGNDVNGAYPPATPRLQDARVVIGGYTYRVRLFKTGIGDSINLGFSAGTGRYDDDVAFKFSEYNQLMYRSCTTNPTQQVGTDWAAYTLGQLSQGWIVCQEVSAQNTAYCYFRGHNAFSIHSATSYMKATAVSSAVWQPVLELIA
jgi:hypothetical protein